MQTHRKTLKAYERMIAFAEDENNSLKDVKERANIFWSTNCNYCSVGRQELGSRTSGLACDNCVLQSKTEDVWCFGGSDELRESYNFRDIVSCGNPSRSKIIEMFKRRHADLALQAEFNLSEDLSS